MIKLKLVRDAGNGELDEPVPVTVDSRDVANWEAAGRGRAFGHLGNSETMRITDLYDVAWFTARRLGMINKDMSVPDFKDTWILDLVPDETGEEEGADPTPPVASSVD